MGAETSRPYRVTSDGAIVDRETGAEIGHVHRTDYGWTAHLTSGASSTMHATRRQACDAAWSMRTTPATNPDPTRPRGAVGETRSE